MPRESLPPTAALPAGPADALPGPNPAAAAPLELTLALRLMPQSQGLGCDWRFSLHHGGHEALQCDSFAGLVDHLARLLQIMPGPAPPQRGIR